MSRSPVLALVLLVVSSAVLGANVEYQGPSGNLNSPTNWYVITDAGNPASRTGVTRMPVPYIGVYPTGTPGDLAILRNTTTTTLNSLLSAASLNIGGPQITGVASQGPTSMYVTSGGTVSLYNDDPNVIGTLSVGGFYPGTLNMDGGSVNIYSRRTSSTFLVGAAAGATGVVNISGGTINVVRPLATYPAFNMAVGADSVGIINQTGGLVQIGGMLDNSKVGRIGNGGYGEYNLSGGKFVTRDWFNVGHGPSGEGGGTGVVNLTGGTWEYGYRVGVGDGKQHDANVGHLRIMGGTLKVAADTDPLNNGHIWLGRGDIATGVTPGAVGKMTITQAARVHVNGILMGMEVWDSDSTQMELKINSDADFDTWYAAFLVLQGTLEVSLTDGFRPAPGTDWRIAQLGPNPQAGFYTLGFTRTTPGFHTEKRGSDIYLVCDALMQPGDANNDGFVDVGDLGILAFNWGQRTVLGKSWAEADFTGDDIVDVGDLGVLAFNWGWVGAPAGAGSTVPEPASLALLAMGGVALIRRRR